MTRTSMRRAAVAMAIGVLVATGCGSGDDGSAGSSEGSTQRTSTTKAASTGSTVAATARVLEVVDSGFTSGVSGEAGEAVVNAAATLRNSGDAPTQVMQVVFTFKDSAGAPVGEETYPIYRVEPGSTAHAQVANVRTSGPAASVEVVATAAGPGAFEPVVFGVEVAKVGSWPKGALIDVTVTNPSADPIDQGLIACTIRSGGKVVGGAGGIVRDTIEPGSSATIQASGYVAGDEAECSGTGVGPT